jgi:glycosyltransferase involved in cell wall biosynthesis
MKILFCKNSFAGPISGADEIAVSYALELKAAGHSPSILLVNPPSTNDPLAARLRAANVPLNTLASRPFSLSIASARRFAIRAMRTFSPARNFIRSNSRKIVFDLLQRYQRACCVYLNENRPDVIHVLTPDPGAVMLIRAAHESNIPVIYQEVGIPYHPPGFEEVYGRFVSVLPLCAGVAALSPCLAQELGRVVPGGSLPQVLPLVSKDHNGTGPAKRNSDRVVFGFAARLEHLKGPMRLLSAFHVAHQTDTEIELKVAGEGSQRQEFRDTSRRLGVEDKCQLVGVYTSLADRSSYMSDIDVFVLPSLTEGTPNVIIEAMAHSKPIIATSVGGVPDVVTDDIGILVPPDDNAALAAAMVRLAGDVELRHRMGLAARKRYEELFTPEAVLPVLLSFYQRAVDTHANGNASANDRRKKIDVGHPWINQNVNAAGNRP